MNWITRLYRTHNDFILLTVLFVTFRLLTLAAFRPGGLVLDFSDFYWYRGFAQLTQQGYYPYENLWTTYPPLFPVVMLWFYDLSLLLPPWEHPNLWFTLLLGSFFLLFETGNFILLYLFGLKLYPPSDGKISSAVLRPCWLYAGLFVPVYTLTGWFESYPLFFFLLSLYLLLINRPYLSAIFTGIGFMIKLIPLILTAVAVQRLSQRHYRLDFTQKRGDETGLERHSHAEGWKRAKASSFEPTETGAQTRWVRHFGPIRASLRQISLDSFDRLKRPDLWFFQEYSFPFDLPRTILYFGLFTITVVAIGLPFYLLNPALFFGPQLITAAREPWETIWALIDGNYNYGVIPLDMRNMAWTATDAPPSRIPWLWVTGITAALYGLVYTRRIDWQQPRTVLAFVGFTLCLFMIWSKGYSPQWLNWVLFFIALLLPNMRGMFYGVVMSVGNIIEANFFFIIFPEEQWLLAATVLLRTGLFAVLALEFLGLIWPVSARVAYLRRWAVVLLGLGLLVGAIPAGWRLGESYVQTRLVQSPYSATITRLQGENPELYGPLLLNRHTVYAFDQPTPYEWFYPYLRHDYQLFVLDDYAPDYEPTLQQRTEGLLNGIAAQSDLLWIYDVDPAVTTPSEDVLQNWLAPHQMVHIQDIDGGRLYLYILQ